MRRWSMNSLRCLVSLALLSVSTTVLRADGATEPPVPVRTVAPEYPPDLRRDGTSGIVMVSCLIDDKGNVQETKIEKSTHDSFGQPAVEAVKRWKFKPARRDGAAVSIRVTIPIKFSVND